MIFVDDVRKTVTFTLVKNQRLFLDDFISTFLHSNYWVKINELDDKYEITIKEDMK